MEFFQRCIPANYYYNYYEMLSNWERCFGFKSLDVSLFSRKSFLNNNLLDDFTAKLDRALIGVLNRDIEIENESLSPVGQAMARGMNLAFPVRAVRPELAQIREKCKASIYNKYRGTGRQPSLAMQQKIYRDFAESNELLRRKFFPQLPVLFDAPVGEPDPTSAIDERVIEGLSALFSELRKHGKDIIQSDEYAAIARNILRGVSDVFDSAEGQNKKDGINAAISRERLRSLVLAANSVESKNLKLARDLLTLVQEIDPSGPDVTARLEAIKRKEALSGRSMYAITYTQMDESSDPAQRQRQSDEFEAWLTSFADCIDGSALNVLKSTSSLRLDNSHLVRKPSISAGFTIVRVDSEEAAYAIASRCPQLAYGGTVFVSEVLHLPPGA